MLKIQQKVSGAKFEKNKRQGIFILNWSILNNEMGSTTG